MNRRRIALLVGAGTVMITMVAFTSAAQDPPSGQAGTEQAAMAYPGPPSSAADAVIDRARAALRDLPGFVGVGRTRTAIGDEAIAVYMLSTSAADQIPDHLEGLPVQLVVVPGGFDTLPA